MNRPQHSSSAEFATLVLGHLGRPYVPKDIAAQAAAILNNTAQGVKHVLDRRAYLDSIGLQDQPMVVIVGEMHANVTHQIHQTLMMSELIKNEDVAVAFEKRHNCLVSHLTDDKEFADYKKQMQIFDRETHGVLTLKDSIDSNMWNQTPLGRFVFNRFLLQNNIKVCFCDAALTPEDYIDQKDPSSLDSARLIAGSKLPASIAANDAMGMAIRNHHMTKMVMEFALKNKLRIVFLQCGARHVAGTDEAYFENSDGLIFTGEECSLSSCFGRAAFPSVGIIQPFKDIPEDDTILICKNLPEVFATYDPDTGKPNEQKFHHHIRGARGEESYLNALLSRTGLASEMVSLSDWKATQSQCKEERAEYRDRAWEIVLRAGQTAHPHDRI